jgi:hypothetical protein
LSNLVFIPWSLSTESPVRARSEALHRRNSPPPHQIRDVMAAAGFTTHSMQVMHRKRFVPRCPSTQTAAGVKSPYGRLMASERMLDDRRVGAGRAGFVAHTSCQRRVSHSSCSRPLVGCHRMRTCVHGQPRNHGRTTRQRMSLRAATIRAAHSHIDTEQLASAAPSHSTSADKHWHPRTPTGGREAGADRRLGRTGGWGGREHGAEASLERKRAWGGREAATVPVGGPVEGSMGRKGAWGGREPRVEGRLGRKGAWGGREPGAEGVLLGRLNLKRTAAPPRSQ